MNAVDNMETLSNNIKNGSWDHVLAAISPLKIPLNKMTNLYEQVRQADLARSVTPIYLIYVDSTRARRSQRNRGSTSPIKTD